MQIDLLSEQPPSGGCGNIMTAMDMLSRYLFAYPTSSQDAKTSAKNIITFTNKHAYQPATPNSDKGSAFVSQVIKEVAGLLSNTLRDATTKEAQTIGMLERSQASVKPALKIERGKRKSLWQQYVSIAVFNYNASHHASIDCEPSKEFNGGIPHNAPDSKVGILPQQAPIPTSQNAQVVLD